MNNDDQILIKGAGGQMKTVGLGVDDKSLKQKDKNDKKKKDQKINVEDLKKELIREIEKQEKQYADEARLSSDVSDKKDEFKKEIIKDFKREDVKEVKKIEKEISRKIPQPESQPKPEMKIPQPVAAEVAMPAFYFNLEDEQEVSKFRNKEQVLKTQKKQKSLTDFIMEIIQASKLSLSDGIVGRLKKVIDSRLRDVRDLLETKEVLMRPKELGGVGLDNDQAQNVLKVIEHKRVELQEAWNRIDKEDLLRVEEERHKKEMAQKEEIAKKLKPVSDYVHPSYKYKSDKATTLTASAKIPGKILKTSQEVVAPAEEGITRPVASAAKYQAAKVVGPIEELASFDLESFRNLGASPQAAADKIKNKISLLQDESFEKRAQGIQAWRSSAVYQNYLLLGRESIEQDKSVDKIIQDKQGKNEPALSFEEFGAVADLNEELSY